MNHAHLAARLTLCLLLTARIAHADPTATAAVPGLNVTISAVEPGVFHLVATPPGNPAPPVSPFVVGRIGGVSSRIPMRWNNGTHTLTVGVRAGTVPGMLTTRHLNVVLPDGNRKSMTYVGRAVQVRFPR